MTVRFTDQEGVSCIPPPYSPATHEMLAKWKRVETIEHRGTEAPNTVLTRPLTYLLEGAALTLGANDQCDNYLELFGELTANGVTGRYSALTLGGSEPLGSFYGVPIEN